MSQNIGALALAVPAPVAVESSDLTVEAVSDFGAFVRMETAWNDAVSKAAIPHPFLRHEWVRTWWEAFGGDAQLHILIARNRAGRIAAIAPLMRDRTVMYGVPVRRLRTIQNDHTPRTGFIVTGGHDSACHAIWQRLSADPKWDVLQINQCEHGSRTRGALLALAASDGCPTGVWKSSDSPYLELRGTWDDYLNSLSAKFRSNLRNRLSRLTRLGEPQLEVLRDRDAIQTASADAWRLEKSGWKEQAGTAIVSDPAVQQFYSTLIERGARAGWLQLLFLTVAGRRIATSYGACFGERLFLFKTGYDPEYAACSPFKLLTFHAIRHASEQGLSEVDFLGDTEPWKQEWTSTSRAHDWVFVFAPTMRARLLHSIKFQWVPELKRWRP